MNLILFSQREGRARQLNLAHPVTLGLIGALAVGILGTAFALGMKLGQRSAAARRARSLNELRDLHGGCPHRARQWHSAAAPTMRRIQRKLRGFPRFRPRP